jgi:hypothetical protein
MNYKKNEAGDVMVRDAKGNPKYISEKLAKDAQLMKTMHFEVVEAPTPFCEEIKAEEKREAIVNAELVAKESINKALIEEEKPVAEVLTAKSKNTKTK